MKFAYKTMTAYYADVFTEVRQRKKSTIESTTKICKVIAEATQRNNSHLIICGDFNYPCIDWEHEFVKEHTDVIKPFIETIQSYYLHQHVFEPTRFRDGQEPSVLDLVFSNEEDMINILMQNPDLGDSDHTCINFVLNYYAKDDDRIKLPNYKNHQRKD